MEKPALGGDLVREPSRLCFPGTRAKKGFRYKHNGYYGRLASDMDGEGRHGAPRSAKDRNGYEVGNSGRLQGRQSGRGSYKRGLPKSNGPAGHFRALPYSQVGAAIEKIRQSGAYIGTKLTFEFLILTAARSGKSAGRNGARLILRGGFG